MVSLETFKAEGITFDKTNTFFLIKMVIKHDLALILLAYHFHLLFFIFNDVLILGFNQTLPLYSCSDSILNFFIK